MTEDLLARRILFFSEMIQCSANILYWQLDPELQLVESSCAAPEHLYNIFTISDCFPHLKRYAEEGHGKPLVMSNSIGLSWIATVELHGDAACRIHMIGPVQNAEISASMLHAHLAQKRYPALLAEQFLQELQRIPMVPISVWLQYGTMLQYAVTGEKIHFSDFNYQTSDTLFTAEQSARRTGNPSAKAWLAETAAMKKIEEGRLDYQESLAILSGFETAIPSVEKEQASRNYQNYAIAFITLATRAAIRGGLDVETAYMLGNMYIADIENGKTVAEMVSITNTMYADFVQRVHKIKQAGGISSAVQTCCNYIDNHIGEKISLTQLCAETGYSSSRLAAKFKEEMGMPVSQYIKECRIDHAKRLLRGSNQSIQEIGDALGFCNTSYFVGTFREIAGLTPGEYRARKSGKT